MCCAFLGPSGNTCPKCAPQFEQTVSTRRIPYLLSVISVIALASTTSIDNTDGFRFTLGDKGWLLFRFSGTFYRITTRQAPHNLYTTGAKLRNVSKFLGAKDHRITANDLRDLETEYGRLNVETSRSVLEFYQSRKNGAAADAGAMRQAAITP